MHGFSMHHTKLIVFFTIDTTTQHKMAVKVMRMNKVPNIRDDEIYEVDGIEKYNCPICLEYVCIDKVWQTSCFHHYCGKCLHTLFIKNYTNCSLCQQNITFVWCKQSFQPIKIKMNNVKKRNNHHQNHHQIIIPQSVLFVFVMLAMMGYVFLGCIIAIKVWKMLE